MAIELTVKNYRGILDITVQVYTSRVTPIAGRITVM